MDRLTTRELRAAVQEFEARYLDRLDLVELDQEIATAAGDLAEHHSLRGYDAVHLAAALSLQEPGLVVVAGDSALLQAARAEGLDTAALT